MAKTESDYTSPLLAPPPPPPTYYSYPATTTVTGQPLAPPPPPPPPIAGPTTVVIVPTYPLLLRLRRRRRRLSRCCWAPVLTTLVLFTILAFLLWPTGPEVHVALLRLDSVHVAPPPVPTFDISLFLRLRLRNPNFYPLSYRSITSSVSYRGRPLGSVAVADGGGVLGVRAVSDLDARFQVDGAVVLDDVVYLIADLAAGVVPLETVTVVDGVINIFSFEIPAKGKISCSVNVNPGNQKIISQDCYSE